VRIEEGRQEGRARQMSRRRFIYREGLGLVEIPPDYRPPERKAPYVISDYHEPFRSHADGKMYDSKSRYRAELKARGMIEVGNESDPRHWGEKPEPPSAVDDICQAVREHGASL
jgi:hypothetical protein